MAKLSTEQIYERFRLIYQEKSFRHFDGLWAAATISDSIDDLDAELADLHPEMVGVISTNLSYNASQQEENLPTGFQEMVMVEVTDRGGPPYPRLWPAGFTDRSGFGMPLSESFAGATSGEPSHYYVRAADPAHAQMKIGWIAIPHRTAVNNILAWYHGIRADVTTIDTNTFPDIPVILHPLIPVRMCVLAAMSDKANVDHYVGLYNSRLEKRLGQMLRGATEEDNEIIEIVDEYD